MPLEIYTDGGARGNPGPAAAGVVIRDEHGRAILEAGYYLGKTTNNVAEYSALVMALEAARKWGADDISVFLDSELVVKQITGTYQVKDAKMRELFEQVQRLLIKFDNWRIKHIRREQNRRADALVNKALDRQANVVEVQLGDARPDDRPVAGPAGSNPARQPAPVAPVRQAPADAAGGPAVIVRCIRGGRPGTCPAAMAEGQEFTFTGVIPAGLCIYAAKAVIDAVLAMRRAILEGEVPMPVRVRCGQAGCGAEFEVRSAGPNQ